MIDGLNESFFVSVTTPAASRDGRSTPFENDNISPFPTFDEGSLMSSNSVETEKDSVPSVATEVQEEDIVPSGSSSSSDGDDDDYDSTDDESSQPTIPEDIGYVIDANGASLLANLNRKLLEYRYGKDYKFDKVPALTKIDVDDAVSTMGRMKTLLNSDDEARFDVQVIPKSPSSVSDKKMEPSPKNREKELAKMIENLTKEDLQVLYKAVMGKDMPVESLDSREDNETGERSIIETTKIDTSPENPLGVPLPSILEESLSGNSADVSTTSNSMRMKTCVSTTTDIVTAEITDQKFKSSSKLGLFKRILFRKRDKAVIEQKKKNKVVPQDGIKRKYSSNNLELQATSAAKSRVSAKSSKETKEEDNSEKKIEDISSAPTSDSPDAKPTEKNEAKAAGNTDENFNINDVSPQGITVTTEQDACPEETKKESEDVVVIIIQGESENQADSEKMEAADTMEDPNTLEAPVRGVYGKVGSPKCTASCISPKEVHESKVVDCPGVKGPQRDASHSDGQSIVCDHTGPNIEVAEEAIEINKAPTIPSEAPDVSDSANVSADITTDQVEKKSGKRFGRPLRGRSKSKSCSPSDEMLQALTADNPVIEIPLSEVKSKRSLLSKYNNVKPAEKTKTKSSETLAPVEIPKTHHDQSSERKAARLRSPLRKNRKPKDVPGESKGASTARAKISKAIPSSNPPPAPKVKTQGRNSPLESTIHREIDSASAKEESKPLNSHRQSSNRTKMQERTTMTSTEKASDEILHEKSAVIMQSSAADEVFVVKENVASAESDMSGPSLRGWTDDDTESIEETGFFCGAVNPSTKDDWLTRIEKSFTQMIDYWDRTPEEAFEESKVYVQDERKTNVKQNSDGDRSISARSRSSRRKSCAGDRSVKSCNKSFSDKSVRSHSEKSVKSRSKSRSDKSVKSRSDKSVKSHSGKSVKSRSKSDNRCTTKLSDATTQEPTGDKDGDPLSSEKKDTQTCSEKVSSDKSTSGKSKSRKSRSDVRSDATKTTSDEEALANASASTKSTSTKRRSEKTTCTRASTTADIPGKSITRSRSSKTSNPTLEDEKASLSKVETTTTKQNGGKSVPNKSYHNPKEVREKRASRKNWNNGTSLADDRSVVVM